MKRIRNPISNKLVKFTYDCGCVIFVTMDLAPSPPMHYHHREFNHPKPDARYNHRMRSRET